MREIEAFVLPLEQVFLSYTPSLLFHKVWVLRRCMKLISCNPLLLFISCRGGRRLLRERRRVNLTLISPTVTIGMTLPY